MVDVRTEMEINLPVEKVAAYAGNPENATTWYVNIKEAKWVHKNTPELGAKIEFTAEFMKKKLVYTYEIVELIPNSKMVMRTAQGPFPMETTYEWEVIDDNQTLMKLRNAGQPKGFSKLMAPLMSRMMRKANMKDLKLIKEILEKN